MKLHAEPKKVLFILYQFPPSNDVGAQRPLRFIKNLGRFGWQAIVLAPANGVYHSYDDQIENLIRAGCTIYRTPMFFPARCATQSSQSIANRCVALSWRAWNRLAMPDGALAWLLPAVVKGIRIARDHAVDLLFASGQPFSTFVIASLIKRRTAKPLLLDYRDPWTLNPFYSGSRLRCLLETQIEKFSLRTADAAIFTTEEGRAAQKRGFTHSSRSDFYHTIPNSFEKGPTIIGRAPAADDHFRLVHAGNLYGNRNPVCLFHALALAARRDPDFSNRIKIMFFGVFSTARYQALARDLGITHMIAFGPRLPLSELALQYARADGLLLINSYGDGHQVFIPSKFFEYLKIGLPILCLAEDGALKKAIERTRSGSVVTPRSSRKIAEALLAFYRRYGVLREAFRPDEGQKGLYEAEHTTAELMRLCEKIINRTPKGGF